MKCCSSFHGNYLCSHDNCLMKYRDERGNPSTKSTLCLSILNSEDNAGVTKESPSTFPESPYIHHVIMYIVLLLTVIILSGIITYQCRRKNSRNQVDITVERRSNTDRNNLDVEPRPDSGLSDRSGYILMHARQIQNST